MIHKKQQIKKMGNELPFATTNIYLSIFKCNHYSEYVLECSGAVIITAGMYWNAVVHYDVK